MQKCLIKISNLNAECKNHKEFDSLLESILAESYGEDFIFDFDAWWRQCSIDFRVRNFSANGNGWDDEFKSTTFVWESATNQIEPFLTYFSNHEMFLKFKNALSQHGWTISSPVIE